MSEVSERGEDGPDAVLIEDLWGQLAETPTSFRGEGEFSNFLEWWEVLSPSLASREALLQEVVYRCCIGSCEAPEDREWISECESIFDNIAHLIEHCPIYVNSVYQAARIVTRENRERSRQLPAWLTRSFNTRVIEVF